MAELKYDERMSDSIEILLKKRTKEDGEVLLAMECVDGVLLSEKLKDGLLKQQELINIATEIADGLNAAHNADITHRDIKYDNIIISKDGTAKILGFGITKQKGV
jgi:serine/threonine protein kinase